MDFLADMDSQQIILGIVVLTLVIAVILYFTSQGNSNTKPEKNIDQVELPPRAGHGQLPVQPEQDSERVLVMFFAPWCGHCKNMEGAWEELRQNFDGYDGVKIVKLNGEENPDMCHMHGVSGFPTVKFCPQGLQNPEGVVYEGDRSITSLAQFLQSNC